MKPIRLTMQAFQSYLEPTTIDFSVLNQNKIFMVSGKTGAGKTTIFDAVYFALYGEVSSVERNSVKQLKTMDADDSRYVCQVILDFEHKGKVYRVTRRPAQTMPSQRGKGTKNLYSAEVTLEDLTDSTKKAVTTNAQEVINGLLGMDKNQFKQVCLIAQGSFSKVLTAPTLEKKNIFRQLFGTGIFKTFGDRLSDELKSAQLQRKSSLDNIESIYSGINVQSSDAEQKNLLQDTNSRIEYLRSLKQKYTEAFTTLKSQQEAVEKSVSSLMVELNQSKQHQTDLMNEAKYKAEIEKGTHRLDEVQSEISDLEEIKPEMEAKQKQKITLESILPEYVNLTNLTNQRNDSAKRLEAATKEMSSLKQTIDSLVTSLEANEKRQKGILDELKDEQDAQDKFVNLKRDIQEVDEKQEMLVELLPEIHSLTRDYQDYLILKATSEKKQRASDELEEKYFASITGILSSKLRDEEPCPVCGSLTHPSPFHCSEQVSEEQYKQAKQDAKEATDRLRKANDRVESETGKAQQKLSEIEKYLSKKGLLVCESGSLKEKYDFDKSIFDAYSNTIQSLFQGVSLKIKQFNILHEEKNQLEQESVTGKQKLEVCREKLTESSSSIGALNMELSKDEESINQLIKKLPYPTKDEVIHVIKTLDNIVNDYNIKLSDLHIFEDKVKQEINANKGALIQIESQISSFQGRMEMEIEDDLKDKMESKEKLTRELLEINSSLQSVSSGTKRLVETTATFAAEDHRYSLILDLNRFFNGKNEDKNSAFHNVDLETFVLARYLDDIIRVANRRLNLMSSGRYILRRHEGGSTGGGDHGLEIDVQDCYTGKLRSAFTLSGGETFMASLSLALGLSDLVKMTTSQKDIDVLFVDEGFGSLDSDSLPAVVQVLQDISMKDNKTVGLISHVEELMPLFDTKLEIEKDVEGHSSIRLVTT